MERRRLLGWMGRALGVAAAGASVGLCAIFGHSSSRGREQGRWVVACRWSELEPGVPRPLTLRARGLDGWYRYEEARSCTAVRLGNEVRVMSRRCTHLGCLVDWDPGRECFLCPCHGGAFAVDGTVRAGPPPRPLVSLPSRVKGDLVEVWLA